MSTELSPDTHDEQPQLEGWSDVYKPTAKEEFDRFVEVINDAMATVRAEGPGRYRAREEERLSRPLSADAKARRERMKRLLRPLGAN